MKGIGKKLVMALIWDNSDYIKIKFCIRRKIFVLKLIVQLTVNPKLG